ncbi:MAG: hypothetical protein K0A99_07670 [Desulfoarculaceae bacterium]|nr:hypothetical protein [Desulfoarculaceae bacterium]
MGNLMGGGFLFFLVLCFFGFIFFCIYYIFKQMQFVIQAINLYKDMVVRQDAMLKILKDIRDTFSGKDKKYTPDVEVATAYKDDSDNPETRKIADLQKTQQEMYDNGDCPECGDKIGKNEERCLGCGAWLLSI